MFRPRSDAIIKRSCQIGTDTSWHTYIQDCYSIRTIRSALAFRIDISAMSRGFNNGETHGRWNIAWIELSSKHRTTMEKVRERRTGVTKVGEGRC